MSKEERVAGILVIAVDCSTTAVKALVLDEDGLIVASAAQALPLSSPRPGWYEQDAMEWLRGTEAAIGAALAQVPDRRSVRALCITHQRESFVCVDRAGMPLRPAILWMDGRAGAEIASLGSEAVHRLSGKPPDVTPALYKIAWLARHEPNVIEKTYKIMEVHAYLVYHLTHQFVTSSGSADALGLFDLEERTYSPRLVGLAGLALDQVTETVEPGTIMGRISDSLASKWRLPAPIPLIAGIGDGQAAGIGAAANRPGRAYLNLGTAAVVGVESSQYHWGREFRTLISSVPDRFCLETLLSSGSFMTDWFQRGFGSEFSFEELEVAAKQVSPGSEGLLTLPYWNGAQTPYWDPTARGAIVGWRGVHTTAHMYRSLLEGVAYEVRNDLEGLETVAEGGINDIRMMGGGARSRLWVKIVADVLCRPVTVCSAEEVSAVGAGVLALAGADGGSRSDQIDIAEHIFNARHRQEPDPSTSDKYHELFEIHHRLYSQLQPTFQQLSQTESDLP